MENANRTRVKRLAVAATLTALALLLTPRERGAHVLFLPMVGRSADARFALSSWGSDYCCTVQEQALGLVVGQGMYASNQVAENETQIISVQGSYDYFGLPYPICLWEKLDSECRDWIANHRGKIWIVGNEPENTYNNGGTQLCAPNTPCSRYSDMFYEVSRFIRQADPTAKIIVGGWSSGNKCQWFNANEGAWIDDYRARYGEIQADGWALHYYGYTGSVDTNVRCFIEGLRIKQIEPRVYISELAYDWAAGEPDAAWLAEVIPQLKAMPEIVRWHFWQPYQLLNGNVPNAAGEMYRSLAR